MQISEYKMENRYISKGVDKGGGARGLKCPQFFRFILSDNIAVHCVGENICIYAINNIPAPTLTNLSTPLDLLEQQDSGI